MNTRIEGAINQIVSALNVLKTEFSNLPEVKPAPVFSKGQRVYMNGQLHTGYATVLKYWTGKPGDTDGDWNRPNQDYPQCEVLTTDGRTIHLNGADLRAGKVRAA